ncbi:hypothetical protein V6Z11_A05G295000 [Gossypium hirsutum]
MFRFKRGIFSSSSMVLGFGLWACGVTSHLHLR